LLGPPGSNTMEGYAGRTEPRCHPTYALLRHTSEPFERASANTIGRVRSGSHMLSSAQGASIVGLRNQRHLARFYNRAGRHRVSADDHFKF